MKGASALKLTLVELRNLYEELAGKERKRLPALKAKQAKLSSALAEVTQEIEAIEGPAPAPARRGRRKGAPAKRGPGRPKKAAAAKSTGKPRGPRASRKGRQITLRAAAAEVLSKAKGTMSPQEVHDAILGQKIFSNVSKSFHQQVNRTLSVNPEFKRRGRGKYSL